MDFLSITNVLLLILFLYRMYRKKYGVSKLFTLLNWRRVKPDIILSRNITRYWNEKRELDKTVHRMVYLSDWYVKNRKMILTKGKLQSKEGYFELFKDIKKSVGPMIDKTHKNSADLRAPLTIEELTLINSSGISIKDQIRGSDYLKVVVNFEGENYLCNKQNVLFFVIHGRSLIKECYLESGWVFLNKEFKTSIQRFEGCVDTEQINVLFRKDVKRLVYPITDPKMVKNEIKLWEIVPLMFQILDNRKVLIVVNIFTISIWAIYPYLCLIFGFIRLWMNSVIKRLLFKSIVMEEKIMGFNLCRFTKLEEKNGLNASRDAPLFEVKVLVDWKIKGYLERWVNNKIGKLEPCDKFKREYYHVDEPILLAESGKIPKNFSLLKNDVSTERFYFYSLLKLMMNHYKIKVEIRRELMKNGDSFSFSETVIKNVRELSLNNPTEVILSKGVKVSYQDKSSYLPETDFGCLKMLINYKLNFIKKYVDKWKGFKRSEKKTTINVSGGGLYSELLNCYKSKEEPGFVVEFDKGDVSSESLYYYLCRRSGLHSDSIRYKKDTDASIKNMKRVKTCNLKGDSKVINGKLYLITSEVRETLNVLNINRQMQLHCKDEIYYVDKMDDSTVHLAGWKGGIVGDMGLFKNSVCFINRRKNVFVGCDLNGLEFAGFIENLKRSDDLKTLFSIFKYLKGMGHIDNDGSMGLIYEFLNKRNAYVRGSFEAIGNSRWKAITSEISSYLKGKGWKFYNITKREKHDGSRLRGIEKEIKEEEIGEASSFLKGGGGKEEPKLDEDSILKVKAIIEKSRKKSEKKNRVVETQGSEIDINSAEFKTIYERVIKTNDKRKGAPALNTRRTVDVEKLKDFYESKISLYLKEITEKSGGKGLDIKKCKPLNVKAKKDLVIEKILYDMKKIEEEKKIVEVEIQPREFERMSDREKKECTQELNRIKKDFLDKAKLFLNEGVGDKSAMLNEIPRVLSFFGLEGNYRSTISKSEKSWGFKNLSEDKIFKNKIRTSVGLLEDKSKESSLSVKEWIKENKPVRVRMDCKVGTQIICENPYSLLDERIDSIDVEEEVGRFLITDIAERRDRTLSKINGKLGGGERKKSSKGKNTGVGKKFTLGVRSQFRTCEKILKSIGEDGKFLDIKDCGKLKRGMKELAIETINLGKKSDPVILIGNSMESLMSNFFRARGGIIDSSTDNIRMGSSLFGVKRCLIKFQLKKMVKLIKESLGEEKIGVITEKRIWGLSGHFLRIILG